MSPALEALGAELAHLARSVPAPFGLKTRDYRAALVNLCRAAGLETSTAETVRSRGTADGYRGRLDLVVFRPSSGALAVVEIDKATIQRKTLSKFKALPAVPPAFRLVVLTRASDSLSPAVLPAVVDAVVRLA